jgi:hypothetical protein
VIERCSRADPDADERSHAHEVIRGVREREDPTHFRTTAMMQFAQPANRLAPPEAFFDQFAFDLTDLIADVARAPVIDGTRRAPLMNVLSDVRRRLARPDPGHKVGHVIPFVGAQRAATRAGLGMRSSIEITLNIVVCGWSDPRLRCSRVRSRQDYENLSVAPRSFS